MELSNALYYECNNWTSFLSYPSVSEEKSFYLPSSLVQKRAFPPRYYVCLILAFLLTSFLINYGYLVLLSKITFSSKKPRKLPPTAPYLVPWFGNTFSFLHNPLLFVSSSTSYYAQQVPTKVALLAGDIFLLQGADNIIELWKQSSVSTATAIHSFCLKNFFGMPSEAVALYNADDSGCRPLPHPESKISAKNRVDYRTHESLSKFLSGTGLGPFFDRFVSALTDRLYSLQFGDEWIEMPDFMEFFEMNISPPIIEAMCGPVLLSRSPNFIRDLWTYDRAIPGLSKGLPRWIIPKAYNARDTLLSNIKDWHAFARKNFNKADIGPDGDADPYWGSEFIRSRQEMFLSMDGMDYDALASSDLGAIWAGNSNAVPSAAWAALDIFRDSELLSRIRGESSQSLKNDPSSGTLFDIQKLIKQPLLQSVYAETLRLRILVYMMRCPVRKNLTINNWLFPQDNIILVSSAPAHTDEKIWNTGKDSSHSLDTFWADRFLIYPDDPYSGPRKRTMLHSVEDDQNLKASPGKGGSGDNTPIFSLSGMAGSWIPYGGGFRACPGRHFAKREIIVVFAMMAVLFDIELLVDDEALKMNFSDYGLGAQRPKGKIPFKIRRR